MNAFFSSRFNYPFNYCPVIWMFQSWDLSNKTSRLHKHCLCVIYNNENSSFEELLEKNNSAFIL